MPTTVVRVSRVLSPSERQIVTQLRSAARARIKADEEARALIRAGLSAGLTQLELADAARVDRGVVHRIKRDLEAAG